MIELNFGKCVAASGISSTINAKFDGAHSPIDQVMLEVAPIEKLVGFYRMGFSLPVLKFNRQI